MFWVELAQKKIGEEIWECLWVAISQKTLHHMWHPPSPLVAPSKTLGQSSLPVSVASLPPGPSPPPDRSFGHPFHRDIGVCLGCNHVPHAWEESQTASSQSWTPSPCSLLSPQFSKNRIRSLGSDSKLNCWRIHSDFELLQNTPLHQWIIREFLKNCLDKWCNLCGNGGGCAGGFSFFQIAHWYLHHENSPSGQKWCCGFSSVDKGPYCLLHAFYVIWMGADGLVIVSLKTLLTSVIRFLLPILTCLPSLSTGLDFFRAYKWLVIFFCTRPTHSCFSISTPGP